MEEPAPPRKFLFEHPYGDKTCAKNSAVLAAIAEDKKKPRPFRFGIYTLGRCTGLGYLNSKVCFQLGIIMGVASLLSSVDPVHKWLKSYDPSATSWIIITMVLVVEKNMGASLRKAVLRLAGTCVASVMAFVIIFIIRAIGSAQQEQGLTGHISPLAVIVYFVYLFFCGFIFAGFQIKLTSHDYVFNVAIFTLPLLGETAFDCGRDNICNWTDSWYKPVGRLVAIFLGGVASSLMLCVIFPAMATQRMAEGIELACEDVKELVERMGEKLGDSMPASAMHEASTSSQRRLSRMRTWQDPYNRFADLESSNTFFKELKSSLDGLDMRLAECRDLETASRHEIGFRIFLRRFRACRRRLWHKVCVFLNWGRCSCLGCERAKSFGGDSDREREVEKEKHRPPFRCEETQAGRPKHSHLEPDAELNVRVDLIRVLDQVGKELWRVCFVCAAGINQDTVQALSKDKLQKLHEGVNSLCAFLSALGCLASGRLCAREVVPFLTQVIAKGCELEAVIQDSWNTQEGGDTQRARRGRKGTRYSSHSCTSFVLPDSLLSSPVRNAVEGGPLGDGGSGGLGGTGPEPMMAIQDEETIAHPPQTTALRHFHTSALGFAPPVSVLLALDTSTLPEDAAESWWNKGPVLQPKSTMRRLRSNLRKSSSAHAPLEPRSRSDSFCNREEPPAWALRREATRLEAMEGGGRPSEAPQQEVKKLEGGNGTYTATAAAAAAAHAQGPEHGSASFVSSHGSFSAVRSNPQSTGSQLKPLEWIAELLEVAGLTGFVALKHAQSASDLPYFLTAVSKAKVSTQIVDEMMPFREPSLKPLNGKMVETFPCWQSGGRNVLAVPDSPFGNPPPTPGFGGPPAFGGGGSDSGGQVVTVLPGEASVETAAPRGETENSALPPPIIVRLPAASPTLDQSGVSSSTTTGNGTQSEEDRERGRVLSSSAGDSDNVGGEAAGPIFRPPRSRRDLLRRAQSQDEIPTYRRDRAVSDDIPPGSDGNEIEGEGPDRQERSEGEEDVEGDTSEVVGVVPQESTLPHCRSSRLGLGAEQTGWQGQGNAGGK
uniref:Uncharacterized protein n=1 Tax=Chromera velia CCMP2878 TaxID=1169474 RepID=A0A0G4HP25_9ALVE|eukprot:Cvel_29700.t1-p1 / transcript=Cvel_29700.t1 / gene=Cvel_29700 / organism=Chromera_velia_CCMP2878 / gene_product=hypothetical protein / transcript_product=hypothetical protein / location=Cvel_scaffold4115:80-4435(-) / protein_length=1054 / sequence_SO=supercontig / SO=protein_coding / is_pseudo=false